MSEVLVEKSVRFNRASFDSLKKLTITDSPTIFGVGNNATGDHYVAVQHVDQVVVHDRFKEVAQPSLPSTN